MAKDATASRPLKKSEYEIRFATQRARKGWQDLRATTRGPLVDAWDFLTKTPTAQWAKNHPLKGELATVTRADQTYERWQYELPGGARIWFYVADRRVNLVDVHTHHPNQTK